MHYVMHRNRESIQIFSSFENCTVRLVLNTTFFTRSIISFKINLFLHSTNTKFIIKLP